jgi:hypothetical protein
MSTPNPNKIIHVEIVDAVGDGGTFYGDHVVTGDPFIDPPPNWEYGQLLFDGYDEDPTGGSSGGAGIEEAPSDGKQYARQDEAWSEVVAVADAVNDDQFAIAEWSGQIPRILNTNPATNWAAVPTGDPNGWVTSGGIVPPAGWYWISASYYATSGGANRVVMYLGGLGETRMTDVGATSNTAGTGSQLVYADGTAAWGGVGIWHDGATGLDFKLTVRMARIGGSSGGSGGGDAGGSIQYHSISTLDVTDIGATEVDLPIVDVYGGPLVVGQEYAVSAEGSFRFGVGATSFVRQTVNINGSPAVECLAYRTFVDNERFTVSASRSWNCDDANPTVTVVASCSAGSMRTYNTDVRRANVTFTPMQSSGGGGDAGPHDHDEYLPLTGGTVTGDLDVAGVLRANGTWVHGNLTVPDGAVRLEGTVDGTRDVTSQPNFYINSNGWTFRSTWTSSRMAFAPSKLTRDSDVLGRAETATLPPEPETDGDGNQTNTAEIEAHDTVPLFDVVTALLAEVKDLKARIEELEGN